MQRNVLRSRTALVAVAVLGLAWFTSSGAWASDYSDLVAADATSARIMSHRVGDVTQLTMGYDMGLGEIRRNRIEMIGESLDSLQVDWTPANMENQ